MRKAFIVQNRRDGVSDLLLYSRESVAHPVLKTARGTELFRAHAGGSFAERSLTPLPTSQFPKQAAHFANRGHIY